jgi:hypothetical protein
MVQRMLELMGIISSCWSLDERCWVLEAKKVDASLASDNKTLKNVYAIS